MQVIYIDTLLFTNLIIDYIILCSEMKLLHIHCKHTRLVFGAIVGALSSLMIFVPFYNNIISIVWKIFSAILITYISFGGKRFKIILIRAGAYVGFNTALCGIILCIDLIWNPQKVLVYYDTVYFDISPKVLIISSIILYTCFTVYEKLSSKNKLLTQIIRIAVYMDDKTQFAFDCGIDTGCNLREPFSDAPVIIVEKEIVPQSFYIRKNFRLVPYSTISGEGVIKSYKADSIIINGKKRNGEVYIGICEDKLKGEVKAITGTYILEAI